MPTEPTSRFLRACYRLKTDTTPVWFMRQAGRYMPEYQAIRSQHKSILEMIARPQVAAEITLQPVDILGVDAAILFADILLPLPPMGLKLEFVAGRGPVIHNPVRSPDDVAALRPVDVAADLGHVFEAIRLVRAELDGRDIPLIGFAGAPFTLAAYMIEGGPSRNFLETKKLMYGQPEAWHALMQKLTPVLIDYLLAQVDAGAQALQLFDSWVGVLNPQDYRRFVQPYVRQILHTLMAQAEVPIIHFGVGATTLLREMKAAGGHVMGLDWRVPLDEGWALLGHEVAVQGNLDPTALFAPLPELERQVRDVLTRAAGRPGHIFNLGHGILQHTPVENVRAVVDMVHEFIWK